MTTKELYENMSALYKVDIPKQEIIKKAVQLGMAYRESQFKDGFQAILDTIHDNKKLTI